MSDSLRNRLIGVVLLLPGLAWVLLSPDIGEEIDLLLSFLAGAFLGSGGALLVTGRALWESRNWWAWTPPEKRP